MNTLDISQIQLIDFPQNQYYRETTDKKQIVLHHTVSGPGARGDIAWWLQSAARIATHFIIQRDGKIVQCFNSRYWAHHLGVRSSTFQKFNLPNINTKLNQQSISIELDSWGGILQEKAASSKLSLVEYPNRYRGFRYFEQYTTAQIQSARKLIKYLAHAYSISLDYQEDIWDLSENALKGKVGVWTHTSFRSDKSDCHPQKELIQMLKTI